MWINIITAVINILKYLFRKKDQTQVNEQVYQEIKDTPKVEEIKPVEEPVNQTINPIEPTETVETVETVKSNLNIIQKLLPPNQYVQDSKFKVQQCVIHHTAGGSAQSTYNYWNSSKDRVATHFLIDRDGTVYQCMPMEKCWGYHLYVASPGNKIDRQYKKLSSKYDAQSIGIELCNFGYVNFVDGKFVNYVGKLIHHDRVVKLDTPYKGYSYWEDYTAEQTESLRLLLLHLLEEYPILSQGLKDDYSNIGEISKDALDMKPGIYGHGQYRTDKYDIFPSQRIITMLNSLKANI